MGIELGSIGTAMGSVASGIGKISAGGAPAVASFDGLKGFGGLEGLAPAGLSALPDVGGIAGSLSEFKASVPVTSIGTGSVRGGFLEGFKTMNAADITTINTGGTIAPLGEILFRAPSGPAVISQAETVAVVAWGKSTVPAWEVFAPEAVPLRAPALAPALEPQIGTQTKTETRVSTGSAVESTPTILIQPAPEGVDEMVIEEEALDRQEDRTEIEESEELSVSKIKIVEAEQVSSERRKKIRKAVRKAKEEGITVAEALPREYWSDKSPLVGEGKDWTLDLTAQALQINPKEYASLEEAEEASIVSVAENIPVTEGASGRQATVDEVRKVTKGEKHVLGPKTPAEIVTKRLIKKKFEVAQAGGVLKVLENKVETKSEPTLKDFPQLAGVFQKAA